MNEIVAESGRVVTDEMIAGWERALEHNEWPSGWVNVGAIVVLRRERSSMQTEENGPDAGQRRIMTPADFRAGIEAGTSGLTSAFAQGYAQALYDAGKIEMDGLTQYVGAAAGAELRRNLANPCSCVADSLDMAAFEISVENVAVSDMLSALSEALKHGDLAAFEREWLCVKQDAPAADDTADDNSAPRREQ